MTGLYTPNVSIENTICIFTNLRVLEESSTAYQASTFFSKRRV